jgi:hypothetical protein
MGEVCPSYRAGEANVREHETDGAADFVQD